MNGTTYLRTYRVLMFLGAASFLFTAFATAVPEDYQTEEYVFSHSGAPPSASSRTGSTPPPSTPCSSAHLPITPRSTVSTCTRSPRSTCRRRRKSSRNATPFPKKSGRPSMLVPDIPTLHPTATIRRLLLIDGHNLIDLETTQDRTFADGRYVLSGWKMNRFAFDLQ